MAQETKEKECAVIHCTNTNLVYSGIDAFQLGGIPTEKYCRPCAIAYYQIKEAMKPQLPPTAVSSSSTASTFA